MPRFFRSKTRGMEPRQRHSTTHSMMLCKAHHDALDGRAFPKLFVRELTERGADGPIEFTRDGVVVSEAA